MRKTNKCIWYTLFLLLSDFFENLLVPANVLGNCFHQLSDLYAKITVNPM